MGEAMKKIDAAVLADAVLAWTGYGESSTPRRDDGVFSEIFGAAANQWMNIVRTLADDFYMSNANQTASDLQEMWDLSIHDFKGKHPEIPDAVAKAFAWCYTFDNR